MILAVVAVAFGPAQADTAAATNVILMVSDGIGFNGFNAASYYQHGQLGQQPYDAFDVKMACSTWQLNADGSDQGYNPALVWNDLNAVKAGNSIKYAGNGKFYEGQNYQSFTDSAAAATALYTGVKTYKGAISVDMQVQDLKTISEIASDLGKKTGVVSSVQWSHATPAAVDAHNGNRSNYAQIANDMLSSDLDVIMGCGHPEYDNDGLPIANPSQFKYVGGQATWDQLKAGTLNGFEFTDSATDIADLANGTYNGGNLPEKVVATARCISTLQQSRSGSGMGERNSNVPDLATMTRAALNVLQNNSGQGLMLTVEGGAVDWANHANDLPRMIEEQIEFNQAVQAVVDWVNDPANDADWSNTLVIVTADHETGGLWGGGTYLDVDGNGFFDDHTYQYVDENGIVRTITGTDLASNDYRAWQTIANAGAGVVPDHQYTTGGHTNMLVPLYAMGVGSDLFEVAPFADPTAGAVWDFNGLYVDNTRVFDVMNAVTHAPEPGTMLLIGLGATGLVARRRRRAA